MLRVGKQIEFTRTVNVMCPIKCYSIVRRCICNYGTDCVALSIKAWNISLRNMGASIACTANTNTGWATWVSAELHRSKLHRVKGIYGNPKSLLIKTLEYNNSLRLYYPTVLTVLSEKFRLKKTRSINFTSVKVPLVFCDLLLRTLRCHNAAQSFLRPCFLWFSLFTFAAAMKSSWYIYIYTCISRWICTEPRPVRDCSVTKFTYVDVYEMSPYTAFYLTGLITARRGARINSKLYKFTSFARFLGAPSGNCHRNEAGDSSYHLVVATNHVKQERANGVYCEIYTRLNEIERVDDDEMPKW